MTTKSQRTIEQIQREIKALRDEMNALEQQEFEKNVVPKLKKLVGNFYKYWNGYNDQERWWMYVAVYGYDDGELQTITIEKTSHNKVEIEEHTELCLNGSPFGTREYIPISKAEYMKAIRPLVREALQHLGVEDTK